MKRLVSPIFIFEAKTFFLLSRSEICVISVLGDKTTHKHLIIIQKIWVATYEKILKFSRIKHAHKESPSSDKYKVKLKIQ